MAAADVVDLEAVRQEAHPGALAVGVRHHHHLVPAPDQELRQLEHVLLHAADVRVEEVRHHQDVVLRTARYGVHVPSTSTATTSIACASSAAAAGRTRRHASRLAEGGARAPSPQQRRGRHRSVSARAHARPPPAPRFPPPQYVASRREPSPISPSVRRHQQRLLALIAAAVVAGAAWRWAPRYGSIASTLYYAALALLRRASRAVPRKGDHAH